MNMSKPIAYAATALSQHFKGLGVTLAPGMVDKIAEVAVLAFLDDAWREGRFGNGVLSQLMDDVRPISHRATGT